MPVIYPDQPQVISSDEHAEPWILEEIYKQFPDYVHLSVGDRIGRGFHAAELLDIYAQRYVEGGADGVMGNHDLALARSLADVASETADVLSPLAQWYCKYQLEGTAASYDVQYEAENTEYEYSKAALLELGAAIIARGHEAVVFGSAVYLEVSPKENENKNCRLLLLHSGLGAAAWHQVKPTLDLIEAQYAARLYPRSFEEMPKVVLDGERASDRSFSAAAEGSCLITGHKHLVLTIEERYVPDNHRILLANDRLSEPGIAYVFASDRDELVKIQKPIKAYYG